MKLILNKIIGKIKNQPYKLDDSISNRYIVGLIFEKAIQLLRGFVRRVGLGSCKGFIFLGKNVKLKEKNKIKLGKNVIIEDYCILDGLSKEGITIGDNVKIGSYTSIKCSGSLKELGKGITIGNNCGIGDYCFFGAAGGITIGNNVIMGQNVRFHSENHNFNRVDIPIKDQGVNRKGITVGNDCWIGAGAVFLDGVTVGDGCVIGANTLVNKDIPPYSVAVGNPVRIIKNRKDMV